MAPAGDNTMRGLWTFVLLLNLSLTATGATPQRIVEGLRNPESVVVAPDGRIFVSVIGEFDKDGDGGVFLIDKGKAVPFATGLDDPKGLAAWNEWLFVADKTRVWRIDRKGKAEVFAARGAFPRPPVFLNDLAVDERGNLYVSDSGDFDGGSAAVYSIDPKGKVALVTDSKRIPGLKAPNGVVPDGEGHLLLVDFGTGILHRVNLGSGLATRVVDGLGAADGIAWDKFGRLFMTDHKAGRVFAVPRPGARPVVVAEGLESAADLCYDPVSRRLLVPDMKAGTVVAVPTVIPGWEVDERPLDLETTVAFPDLQWTGWQAEENGKPALLRPLILTHAGDDRVFIATQQGVIHVFHNDDKATKTKVFLDIQKNVTYTDDKNEEGLLGLAFHPQFKKNGELYVFYTSKNDLVNHLSRFHVHKDDPDAADRASEEVLLRVKRPFWNHDGGTVVFGPDGYLYLCLGDGGAADDPYKNGQNLSTLLGKVLRIDVDNKGTDTPYAIPADNPFVGRKGARGEIWAYGLRNVWRMAFDRRTKTLWAADVGQNLYEEINLIERGGNYGWNLREGLHPFGLEGVGPRKDLIEPIWEYHHDVGKSIIGGLVYRGKDFPELEGAYLYADYVTGKIWALWYDVKQGRVVANRPIRDRGLAIMSFGEDSWGEVYLMTYSSIAKGVYRLKRTTTAK
jgi:glucose/arabinose dehydrogenase